MYKFEHYRQLSLADFNQPLGFKMNPENRWVKKAAAIPWDAIGENMQNFFWAKRVCLRKRSVWHSDYLRFRNNTAILTEGLWSRLYRICIISSL